MFNPHNLGLKLCIKMYNMSAFRLPTTSLLWVNYCCEGVQMRGGQEGIQNTKYIPLTGGMPT